MKIERESLVLVLGTAGLAALLTLGYMGADDPNEVAGAEVGLFTRTGGGHEGHSAFPPVAFDSATHAARALPSDIDMQKLDVAGWQARGRDPLLNSDLVRIFEQLIGRDFADSGHLAQQVALRVPAEYAARAQALLDQYRRYRDVLSDVQSTADGQSQSGTLAGVLATRMDLQRKYFSEAEIAGMFADDNRYDAFTVERLKVTERDDLGTQQKEEAIAKLVGTMLSPEQQETRQAASLPIRMMAQNETLERSNATADERHVARSAAFGEEAAVRMADVDRSQVEWQQRIARLAEAAPGEQAQLRASLFTPTEQLRLDGALALYRSRK